MRDARIGRVLVASLHQAIADIAPLRLEFYEHWLNSTGLREGTIGLASVNAVLSFLRREELYELITRRAGEYAAAWTFADLTPLRRLIIQLLPVRVRSRAVLRLFQALIRSTYTGSRAAVKMQRGAATVTIRGSLFCQVREVAPMPQCGFYAAAASRLLQVFNLLADTRLASCRAAGGSSCLLSVIIFGAGAAAQDPALAACLRYAEHASPETPGDHRRPAGHVGPRSCADIACTRSDSGHAVREHQPRSADLLARRRIGGAAG